MTPKLFSELGLSPEVLKAIDKLGFEQASPIQGNAIPILMAGGDVVGQSQTGSGKTAAFAIPAIEKVDPRRREVQVLILCPTRELAIQVSEEVHKLALYKTGLHALPIYGGQSFERQLAGLKQGANIVIGTPGRVMDHMRRGTLKLGAVKFAVLDEVDVMLNMGFREDIEVILQAAPVERQTVFFSATIPRPIQQLIEKYSRNPEQVRIEQKALTVPTVEQVYYEVPRDHKVELLTRLIDIHDLKLGIVFCNTKRMVDDLVEHLNAQGYSADRLHGDMNQQMRDRVMNRFRKSGLEFLVATDVAARGIDVDDVQVVFNYDLPYDVEDYLHRIGRTGRAGRSGRAISFVSGREFFQINNIERFTKVRIQRGKVPTIGEVEEARMEAFLERLRATLVKGEFRRQDHLIERLLEEGFTSPDILSALLHHLQVGDAAAPSGKSKASKPQVTDDPEVGKPQASEPQASRPQATRPQPEGESRPPRPPVRDEHRLPWKDGARPAGDKRQDRRPEPYRQESRPVERRERPARPGHPERDMRDKPDSRDRRDRRPEDERAGRFSARKDSRPGPPWKKADREGNRERPVDRPRRSDVPAVVRAVVPHVAPHVAPHVVPRGAPPVAVKAPHVVDADLSGAGKKIKKSRRTPVEQTRLWMNVGEAMGVLPIDVVNAVVSETGLSGKVVGTIDVRDRHLFADVAAEHAADIVAKLNRGSLKGHKLKVKTA